MLSRLARALVLVAGVYAALVGALYLWQRPLQYPAPRLLQPRIVIGRHPVEAVDLMTERQQATREMEADETGRAGDENAHWSP